MLQQEQWFQTAAIGQALLETAPDAIVVVNDQADIVLVNEQTEKMFGYPRAELLGQPLDLLIPADRRQQHSLYLKGYLKNPQVRPMGLSAALELHGCRRDGSLLPVEISLSPLATEHGLIVLSAIRDVTGRKKIEQALRESHEQLEQKVQERTQELQARNEELDAFAHTVAHDLKSPLSVMVGMADVLHRYYATFSPAELEQYLATIIRDGHRMDNIITELLTLASVRQAPQLEPVDMESLVAEAIRRLEYKIKETQAEITLPPDWPAAVGYAPWLESVWTNYISNALKYGGQPPVIELGASPLPAGRVKFWVRDNGQGISTEEQARLFHEFARLEHTRRIEGHGIGLSTVRRIIEKLHGQVGLESRPGQGSTFFFTLNAFDAAQD